MPQNSIWATLLAMFGRHSDRPEPLVTAPQPAAEPGERYVAAAPPVPLTSKQRVVAACIAAGLVVAPFTASFEGEVRHPYRDPAGILTWCYGQTQGKPELVYTHTQCGDMLRSDLAKKYAPKVIACVPGLVAPERRNVFAALLDAAYNAGPAAVCRSPMARAARAGQWIRTCTSFPGWYTTARGRTYPGLVRRRLAEKGLCLKGV